MCASKRSKITEERKYFKGEKNHEIKTNIFASFWRKNSFNSMEGIVFCWLGNILENKQLHILCNCIIIEMHNFCKMRRTKIFAQKKVLAGTISRIWHFSSKSINLQPLNGAILWHVLYGFLPKFIKKLSKILKYTLRSLLFIYSQSTYKATFLLGLNTVLVI